MNLDKLLELYIKTKKFVEETSGKTFGINDFYQKIKVATCSNADKVAILILKLDNCEIALADFVGYCLLPLDTEVTIDLETEEEKMARKEYTANARNAAAGFTTMMITDPINHATLYGNGIDQNTIEAIKTINSENFSR